MMMDLRLDGVLPISALHSQCHSDVVLRGTHGDLVTNWQGGKAHVVARKGFLFDQDLVSPMEVWSVKARHEQMKICSESLHDGHLVDRLHRRTHEFGDSLSDYIASVHVLRDGRVAHRCEMAF